jgi:hypothetical protein
MACNTATADLLITSPMLGRADAFERPVHRPRGWTVDPPA